MTLHKETVHGRYAKHIGGMFGSLRLLRISDVRGDNNRIYGEFLCSCGSVALYPIGRIITGTRTHCGCLTDRGSHRTHGMRDSAEYSSWAAMKNRCLCETSKDYPRYGGIGVTVHDEWIDSFDSFYRHIGPRPKGTSLDRIDNSKGYKPGNVRWATQNQQQRNRRTSCVWHIRGLIFQTAKDAGEYFGVTEQSIHKWVKGYFDKRRGTFTPAKDNCYAISRY